MQLIPLQNVSGWGTHSKVTHWQLHMCASQCVCWCVPPPWRVKLCLCKCEFTPAISLGCTPACRRALGVCCLCVIGRSTIASNQARSALALPGQTSKEADRPSSLTTCTRGRSFSLYPAQVAMVQPLSAWATICHHGDVCLQHLCHSSSDSCMLLFAASYPAKPAQIPQLHLMPYGL